MSAFLDLDQVHTADRAGLERLADDLSTLAKFADNPMLYLPQCRTPLGDEELRCYLVGVIEELETDDTREREELEKTARKLSDMRMFADRLELHDRTLLALLSTAELRALVDGAVAEFKDSLG